MSALHFAAWGSVDIESMERLQRRAYINQVRAQLKEHGLYLFAGGTKGNPSYHLKRSPDTPPVAAGSFKEVCAAAQDIIDGRRTI